MDTTVVLLVIVAVLVLVLVLVCVVGLSVIGYLVLKRREADEERPRKSARSTESQEQERPDGTAPVMTQLLGIHPTIAVIVVVVDIMLTALDATVVGWPVSCVIAAGLGVACYIMQKNSYGDKSDVAFAKAIIVAVLTAIPTPIPSFLTATGGVVGAGGLMLGCGKRPDE